MIRFRWLILAIATFLLLVACIPKSVNLTCDTSLPNTQPPPSDKITIAIYVDGTPSMEGYVKNTTSRYVQTIELLNSILATAGKRSQPTLQYYRLGTTIQPITREQFRQAQLPKFYDGSNPNFPLQSVSQIEAAITPPDEGDKLSVIITDLYQKEADTTLLSQKIKENYLNSQRQGYAVGILASKSEFNGTIYDVGIGGDKFPYNTEGKEPEKWHPFYVIFIGPETDIAYYFDKFAKLREEEDLPKDSQLVIFSTSIVSQLTHIEGSPQLPSQLNSPLSLNDGNVAVEINNEPIELLEIDKNASEEFPIEYSVPFKQLSHTLPIESNSIATKIQIQTFDTFDKEFKQSTDPQLEKAIEISEWKLSNSQNLDFTTKIKSSNFQQPGVYFFQVEALVKDLQEPSWWKDWNSSENSQDGSKTHNLLKFLGELKTITIDLMNSEGNKSIIGRFCYGIQKN
ncbi:MAG TPA: hypothetical protein DEG17_09560 [Cyanobacteria bacterium UBA11149]|nr:hypothetical protein [Cyanobacteria bacterium UBA11367]HBE57134.1 hypothetical protein [Cyanobacteria bacterium UBA11366]HBK64422.1 hypothetical protein [Cyanobacteria bacterium UBA11166]HBR75761.1 hypothetical protein [Cyanobacteria bacterium UBA11159]HBS69821.1 hypothetical protein [Cyanobacteria bacterium UBA11153]HBW89095.1 hypothetical protein [Cyanobacteria bacterium UBA11149]HCA96965.1 hypothetical protein [Cyanobacteria bacterium UBA9226]